MMFLSLLGMLTGILFSIVLMFFVHSKNERHWKSILHILWIFAETIILTEMLLLNDNTTPSFRQKSLCLGISVGILITDALLLFAAQKKYNHRISKISIKEGTDKLPLGLCFYYSNGMPILINTQMNDLAVALTGQPIRNANTFCNEVNDQTLLIGDKYFSFRSEPIHFKGEDILRLSAVDITQLHRLYLDLDHENEQLKELNEHLLAYSRNVDILTRDEEILKTKIDIHDKMGRILLETKIFLENGASDFDHMIRQWKQTIQTFKSGSEPEPSGSPIDNLMQIAASMNLNVTLHGTLTNCPVFVDAIKECITNAVRHAQATELSVTAAADSIAISNNGIAPAETIVESGGLKNLRENVERNGGTMWITTAPVFTLHIRL